MNNIDSEGACYYNLNGVMALKGCQSFCKDTSGKIISPKKNGVIEDIKNFELFNTDEPKVLASGYFSAYKGRIVIRVDWARSGSLGVLFIKRNWRENTAEDYKKNEIRHEYGHTVQLVQVGILLYLIGIGIPSILGLGPQEYYNRPQEITADFYGGVIRPEHTENAVSAGHKYLQKLKVQAGEYYRRLFY